MSEPAGVQEYSNLGKSINLPGEMTSERWRQIEALVQAVRGRTSAQREALLAAGVGMSDIGDMLIHGTDALHVDFGTNASPQAPP